MPASCPGEDLAGRAPVYMLCRWAILDCIAVKLRNTTKFSGCMEDKVMMSLGKVRLEERLLERVESS